MKNHPRAHLSDDLAGNLPANANPQASGPSAISNDATTSSERVATEDPPDELARIRLLLRPPQIPGLDDWGIPPESTAPCDPVIEASSRVRPGHVIIPTI